MTSQDQGTSALIDQTVKALNGNPSDVPPAAGASVVDSWISALGADSSVSTSLGELKYALQGGSNGSQIGTLMMSLSEQTKKAASSADGSTQSSLHQLASSLRSFGEKLT